MMSRPVTGSFDVFFDLRLNKRLSKQPWGWWFETLSRPVWRHFNVQVVNTVAMTSVETMERMVSIHPRKWLGVPRDIASGDLHSSTSKLTILPTYITCGKVQSGENQNVHDHNSDVTMGAMAYRITSLTTVYSSVCSGADQRKYQSSASLAFVRGIHRWPVNFSHKGPVTRKTVPFDDVIMVMRDSKDPGVRAAQPKVDSGRKWKVTEFIEEAESRLWIKKVVGTVQQDRRDLGWKTCRDGQEGKKEVIEWC